MLMIAAGYEDGNDADSLRHDPVFKLALDRLPDGGRALLAADHLAAREPAGTRARCCAWRAPWSSSTAPASGRCRGASSSTSTTPSTPSTAGSNCGSSTPTTTSTASSRSWCSTARAARSPPCCARRSGRAGAEARAFLRRLVREIRGHWPRVEILIRADSHYCAPEVLDFCRAEGSISFSASPPPRRCAAMSRRWSRAPRRRAAATPGSRQAAPLQGVSTTAPAAGAGSSGSSPASRPGREGIDTRFVVTNLAGGTARSLYEDLLQARTGGKSYQGLETAPRRRSHLLLPATANQFRLMLHTGAYWLMWSLRSLMPKRSTWRVAQFDTLRLRLVKLAARVVALKTRVMLHLPSACPVPRPSCASLSSAAAPDLLSTGADAPAEPSQPQPPTPQSAPSHRPQAGVGNARLHNYAASDPALFQASFLTSRIFRASSNTVHFVR